MPKKRSKKGIGGWLLFFIIIFGCGFLQLVSEIIRSLPAFSGTSIFSKAFVILIFIGALLMLNAATLLLQEAKSAPKWTIITLWSLFVLKLLSLNLLGIAIYGIWAAIWTVYFIRSKRVKVTYTKDVHFSM